jgi:hypothetical protein
MSRSSQHEVSTRKELKLVQFSTNENCYFIEDEDKTIGVILHINTKNPVIHMKEVNE